MVNRKGAAASIIIISKYKRTDYYGRSAVGRCGIRPLHANGRRALNGVSIALIIHSLDYYLRTDIGDAD